jgi:hypothetical protein
MSLFTSLFSLKALEKPSGKKDIIVLTGIARFEIEITVEEHHQRALEAICGPRKPREVKRFETARLMLEEKNPQTKNAVRVEIRGKLVGYLSPEDAVLYRRLLISRDQPTATGQCQAAIRGGWLSSDGRKGPYEVWLDLPTWNQ